MKYDDYDDDGEDPMRCCDMSGCMTVAFKVSMLDRAWCRKHWGHAREAIIDRKMEIGPDSVLRDVPF